MCEVDLFVEDDAHESFLVPLLKRIAKEEGVQCRIRPLSVTGGRATVLAELRRYLQDLKARPGLPDLILVATDANCDGHAERQKALSEVLAGYPDISPLVVLAVPDPHIERWFLLDSAAFKAVLGHGCQAPDLKCDRDRYKHLFARAVRDAGLAPLLGGLEYAGALVQSLDLDRMTTAERSLGRFLRELRSRMRALAP